MIAERLKRALPGGSRGNPTAEAEVETRAHHARGRFEIDKCRAQSDDLRGKADVARAKIVIAVFDEAGQKVGKGVLAADPDGPARARLARGVSRPEHDRGRPIIVALPGAAAPDI